MRYICSFYPERKAFFQFCILYTEIIILVEGISLAEGIILQFPRRKGSFLILRELHHHLEQISVQHDLKGAALYLDQVLGNGKTQSASVGGP